MTSKVKSVDQVGPAGVLGPTPGVQRGLSMFSCSREKCCMAYMIMLSVLLLICDKYLTRGWSMGRMAGGGGFGLVSEFL